MYRFRTLALAALVASSLSAQTTATLRISSESAPPGQIVQLKIQNTEPVPILTGGGGFESSFFSSFDGFAVFSDFGDASATAVLQGNRVKLSVISPKGDFGNSTTGYPLMVMAGRIDTNLPVGASTQVALDLASLNFQSPTGTTYISESKPGTITAANVLSISNVVPGSGLQPAGTEIAVYGTNFTSDMKLKLGTGSVKSQRLVSSTEARFILGSATIMHGNEVRATNKTTTVRYYSYQRTVPAAPSSNPVLAVTAPMFDAGQYTDAVFSSQASDGTRYFGFAFQNIGASAASIRLRLVDVFGNELGRTDLTVAPNQRLLRASTELLPGVAAPVGTYWRAHSDAPLQMMQIRGDTADFSAIPAPYMQAQ